MKINPISFSYNAGFLKESQTLQKKDSESKNFKSIPSEIYKINFVPSLSFTSKRVYSFTANGFLNKYNTPTEAAKGTGVRLSDVSIVTSKKPSGRRSALGYVFVKEKDLERINKEGETVVDLKKGAQIAIEKLRGGANLPVYLFNFDGGLIQSFENIQEISSEYNTTIQYTSSHFKEGKRKWYGRGLVFKWEEVCSANEDGTIGIDFGKVKRLIKKEIGDDDKEYFYVVNKRGEYKKYLSKKEAADALNVTSSILTSCLNGKERTVRDNYIIPSKEVDVEVDGILKPDEEKIKNYIREKNTMYGGHSYTYSDYLKNPNDLKALFFIESAQFPDENFPEEESSEAVYTLSGDDKLIKYSSLNTMIRKNNLDRQALWMSLASGKRTIGNLFIFRASEIEDEEKKIDSKKVTALIKKNNALTIDSAIYVFRDKNDKKGTRCENEADAALVLGVSKRGINYSLSKGSNIIKGHPMLRASLVEEIDENGLCSINRKKWDDYFNNREEFQ